MARERKCFLVVLCALFIGVVHAQSLITKNFTWEGNEREYAIYIPASYDGSVDFPLVINFHGGGDYIDSWMEVVDMRPLADTADFILIYPQASPDPTDGGSTNWVRKSPTTFDDVPFVEEMIDLVSTEYSINSERIYACGYSLGGEFTYELACSLSNRIAAVGVVARTKYIETFNNCSPEHSTGVISILGTDDFISNYDGITFGGIQYYLSAAETHEYWVNHNECDLMPTVTQIPNVNTSDGSTVERYTWNNPAGCTYVEHLKVNGGGHDWPGDFGNMDINASEEIWNFVSQYDLDGIIECSTSSSEEIDNSEKNYKVYPNPFKDQLIVEVESNSLKAYEIYSTLGELKMTGKLEVRTTEIDLSSLTPNVYFLRIGNAVVQVVKI